MNEVFVSLGTNLGDRLENLNIAYLEIGNRIGTIIRKSSFYKTPPWGFNSDQDFVNSVILVGTDFDLEELLIELKKVETDMGRRQRDSNQGYQDRVIDLDIIDFNGVIHSSKNITVPHERMHLRNFVLFPLAEIAPNWFHPVLKKSIKSLKYPMLQDDSIVKLI